MAHTPFFHRLRRAMAQAALVAALHDTAKRTHAEPTRRRFLAGAGSAAALSGTLGACASTEEPGRYSAGQPIVIIGAGLAGLTAAWRLARANVPCVVYEASGRIGGRVWTAENFNAAGQFVELGAELVDSNHEDLQKLCQELGVGIQKFSDPAAGITRELFHYRGRLYTNHDLERELPPLLAAVGRARKEIQGRRNEIAVSWDSPMNARRFDNMSLAQFLAAQNDVADWVREMVRVAYVGEMGAEADEQSALNLILLMDPDKPGMYGESDEAHRVAGGSSSTVKALRAAIARQAGGSEAAILRTEHELLAVRERGGRLALTISQNGTLQELSAERVIVTLPFSVLRHVEGVRELPLHPVKRRAILDNGYGANAKIMSDFRDRPWRTPGGTLPAFDGFLTTDAWPQTIWETSRDQPGANGILTDFVGGREAARVTAADRRRPVEYLARLDPRIGRSFTGQQRFMNWANNRFSRGSYSSQKVGQYTTTFGIEGKAELGGRLLFAGEHTSIDFTGFMNGAVESGNRVAREILQPGAKAA